MRFDEKRRNLIAQLISLIVLSYFAYSSIIFVNFSYDDIPLIVENPHLRSISGLWEILKSGRPVRGISFWLDYQIWGLDARGFHFTNIILNIFCTVSAFFLVRNIFQSQRLAFISALIFTANPINSEAVTNVAHRKELLCFLFLALSFISFKKSFTSISYSGLSLIFYLLALLSKQVALTLPFLFVLDEYIFGKRDSLRMKRTLIVSAIYLALPIIGFIFSLSDFKLFSRFQPPDFFHKGYISIQATEMSYFPKYIKMAFLPAHLNLDHYIEYAGSFKDGGALFGLFVFLLSFIIFLNLFFKRSGFGFGFGWFLLNLLPVLNFIPANQIFSERYLYIPSLGVAIIIALIFEKAGRSSEKYLHSSKFSLGLLLAFNILFLSYYFTRIIYEYRERLWAGLPPIELDSSIIFLASALCIGVPSGIALSLWHYFKRDERTSLLKEMLFFVLMTMASFCLCLLLITSLAYHRLIFPIPDYSLRYQGYLYVLSLIKKESSPLFSWTFPHNTTASEITYFVFYNMLCWGIIIWLINHYARRALLKCSGLFLVVLFAPVFISGLVFQTKDRTLDWGSEGTIWKATLRENPRSFLALNNLGRAFVLRNKLNDAMMYFIKAHSVKPNQLEPILNMGNTMLKANEMDFAEHYYRWALKLNPYSFPARLNLGNCLLMKKDYQLAIENYLEALRIKPDSFEATYNLAVCFLELGDRSKAWLYLQKTLQLAPEHRPTMTLLQKLKQGPE